MRRALAIALVLVAGVARAQTAADIATARDLFREGMQLRADGKLSEALAKLAAAHALYQTPASALELGRAQIDSGKLAEGCETLLSIERIPKTNESSRSKSARVEAAALAEKTKARIPTLRVDVSGADADATVTLDGEKVPPALYGVARKVDPGHHVIVARSAAGDTREVAVDVAERQEATASIDVPAETKVLAAIGGLASAPAASPPHSFSVLYKFLPPDTTERWALRGRGGAKLCTLPCEEWIGEHSGDYLVRAPIAADPQPRRVELPELLPAPIGATVTARPHAGRGSKPFGFFGEVLATLGALGAVGGFSTSIVGLIDFADSSATTRSPDTAIVGGVMLGVSAVLLVSGILITKDNYAEHLDITTTTR